MHPNLDRHSNSAGSVQPYHVGDAFAHRTILTLIQILVSTNSRALIESEQVKEQVIRYSREINGRIVNVRISRMEKIFNYVEP